MAIKDIRNVFFCFFSLYYVILMLQKSDKVRTVFDLAFVKSVCDGLASLANYRPHSLIKGEAVNYMEKKMCYAK